MAAAAAGAVTASPNAVKLLHGGINQGGVVGEDSGLEVASVAALHPYSGSCEIGRPDVGGGEVKNQNLEMHARAQHPLKSLAEDGVSVEVLPEGLTGFLGVYKSNLNALLQKFGQ